MNSLRGKRATHTPWLPLAVLAAACVAGPGSAAEEADGPSPQQPSPQQPSPEQHWPQWRGPAGSGVAEAAGVPVEWAPDKNIAWRTPLPGPAGATPALWGGRLFLTTADGDDLKLQAYAADTGQLAWERLVTSGDRSVFGGEGNYASPSPVTDGRHVFAAMGNGALACFTLDGDPVWSADLDQRYGPLEIQFGYTSTPVLRGGRLYVQMIHGEGDPATHEARVVCLDSATGDELWAVPRVTGASRECEHAYTSPLLYGRGPTAELLTHGADYLIAYAPADGRELWRLGGMNPPGNYQPTFRFVASPAAGGGLIVVPTAKGGPVFAVRPGGRGDVTGTGRVAWSLPRGTPDVPSPLVHEGLVYLCGEKGTLTCVDAATGGVLYRERFSRQLHRASPVLAGGRLYLTSREGVTTVVAAGREFKQLAENDLGEAIGASPVMVGQTIYLRTFDALYAIREAGP
ncbi:MAG: PQQ-binding-like beta-propeller repeat protein [Planctomycetota bacterium]